MTGNLLEFHQVQTNYYTGAGVVQAVNQVSFTMKAGETLCVVGESGCGKSSMAMSVLRLVPAPGKIESGQILYKGVDLLQLTAQDMRRLRGNEIAIIFQNSLSALNPVLTIGTQLTEPMLLHCGWTRKEAKQRAIDLIDRVGIPRAAHIFQAFPHELSGGTRQRIMIAMALVGGPQLLIADEPTSSLDVTTQAQILDLMRQMKQEFNMSLLLITHDFGIVAEMADHVIVMYAGKVIEEAPVLQLFQQPQHPYTQGLLRARPVLHKRVKRLYTIPGQVSNPVGWGTQCDFSARCEHCLAICQEKLPILHPYGQGHKTACWLYEQEGERHAAGSTPTPLT